MRGAGVPEGHAATHFQCAVTRRRDAAFRPCVRSAVRSEAMI